jgi:hypothetical protein
MASHTAQLSLPDAPSTSTNSTFLSTLLFALDEGVTYDSHLAMRVAVATPLFVVLACSVALVYRFARRPRKPLREVKGGADTDDLVDPAERPSLPDNPVVQEEAFGCTHDIDHTLRAPPFSGVDPEEEDERVESFGMEENDDRSDTEHTRTGNRRVAFSASKPKRVVLLASASRR